VDTLPIVKGSLDILILKTLTWGPMHGFEITRWIEDRSGALFSVDDSALYQSLHRMEERGWISATWGITELKRKARYYELTPIGRAQLRADAARWMRYAETLAEVLSATA
jgi:PadR family transcriptional regulator